MAAKSTNYLDVISWIKDVIDSCKTIEHCEATRNLINNFQKKGRSPEINRSDYVLNILDLKDRLSKKIIDYKNGKGEAVTEA